MQTINGTGGLCVTCNNVPDCYYHARRGPVLFCELFDNHAPPAERPGRAEAVWPAEAPVTLKVAAQEDAKYSGLCMNCRHRATCGHPRPTGGVWHCEDYE